MPAAERKVRLAHSPDADDAFMFCGLATGAVPAEGLEIEHVLEDIEPSHTAPALGGGPLKVANGIGRA